MSLKATAQFGVLKEVGGGATPALFDVAQFDNSNFDVYTVLVGADIYVPTNVLIPSVTPVPLPFNVVATVQVSG